MSRDAGHVRTPPRRVELAFAATLALVFGAAPTVGDVGGCGTTATPLDSARFARARKSVDCTRCTKCGLSNARCRQACAPDVVAYVTFPSTCQPLLHDGEVCIRALEAASCRDFAPFVDDVAPTTPTECGFCREADDGGVE